MITDEAKRLKLFLEREGMNQKDLAPVIKKDPAAISRYLSGQKRIPLSVVKLMHIHLKLNYSWFFHGTGAMKLGTLKDRNILTDLTDIQAGLGVILASQDQMRELLNKLARDFYAQK